MNTLLKLVVAVCIVGIVAVVAIGTQGDPSPQSVPAAATPAPTSESSTPQLSLTLAPTTEPSTTPPAGPASDTQQTQAEEPAFWIEELAAECDAADDDFAVTALPLGADWRVTERGVYKNSPVTITCETGGATEGLTYDWSADEGEIEGSGASIVWTAPDHGAKIKVSVMVRDGSGGEELAALNFRVATCECVYKRYE